MYQVVIAHLSPGSSESSGGIGALFSTAGTGNAEKAEKLLSDQRRVLRTSCGTEESLKKATKPEQKRKQDNQHSMVALLLKERFITGATSTLICCWSSSNLRILGCN